MTENPRQHWPVFHSLFPVFYFPFLLCMGIVGCAPGVRPPASPLPAPSIGNPADPLSTVRRRDLEIQTLRARFVAVIEQADEARQVDGVLLVKKPDRFRMRLLSTLGLTVFDYNSQGIHAQLELPLEGVRWTDAEIDRHTAFAPRDIQETLTRGELPTDDCLQEPGEDEVAVSCRNPDGTLRRELRVRRWPAAVTRDTRYAKGQPQLVIDYADYRETGALLPYRIDLTYPGRAVVTHIHVRGYEVNPVLADSLFQ